MLNDDLPTVDQESVEAHLLGCQACRLRVESLLDDDELETALGRLHGSDDATPADTIPATIEIEGYEIRRVLAAGEQGVVYEAKAIATGDAVAIKILRTTSRQQRWRFEHETDLLRRLDHPGIARFYGAGIAQTSAGPRPFISIELVRGVSITDYCRQCRLSTDERLRLFLKVVEAAHFAHENGVLHRDLKPANILVDPTGRPRILDFGIARDLGADVRSSSLRTIEGQLVGTLAYMAPEQMSGDPSRLDARADIYALGVILYELIARRLPKDIAHKPLPEAARIIADDPPVPLTLVVPRVNRDIDAVTTRALQTEPTHRYQTALALGQDVARVLRNRTPLARRDAIRLRVLSPGALRVRLATVGLFWIFGVLVGVIAARGCDGQ